MENKIKNYGFDEKSVKVEKQDFVFGSALPLDVVQENGQWDFYLPEYEPQAENYETWGCTIWGTQNQIETYFKKVYGFEPNYSERYNYNIVGINPPGANPNDAYQSIRHDGLVNADVLPVTDTLAEFKTPRPMDQVYLEVGSAWLKDFEFYHEWVQGSDMKAAIMNALKFSPVAVSVTAWYKSGDYYVDNGMNNTHWCLAYGWKETSEGVALKVFDSYDHSHKLLHPNHRTAFAKRIYIKKKDHSHETPSVTYWEEFLYSLSKLIQKIRNYFWEIIR